MLRIVTWIARFFLFAAAMLTVVAPARADNVEEARRLYREANEAFGQGNFARAAELYQRSLKLVNHANTLENLAAAEARAGQHVQAARHYRQFLDGEAPPRPEGERREKGEQALAELEQKVGRLRIHVDTPAATITVNGDAVGKSPLGFEWHVAPGEHEVAASKPGMIAKSERVTVAAGEVVEASLVLGRTSDMPGAGLTTPDGPPPSNGDDPTANGTHSDGISTKTVVGIAGLGLSAVALGVGVGFGLDANSKQGEADDLVDRVKTDLGEHGCRSNPTAPVCSELRDKREAANRSADVSTVGFIASGVLLVGTAVAWLVWPDEKRSTARPVELQVVPGRHGSMFGVSGSF